MKTAEALSLRAISYDTSKALFGDVLGAKADVAAAANFLLLDRDLGKLRVGHAIVKLQGRTSSRS